MCSDALRNAIFFFVLKYSKMVIYAEMLGPGSFDHLNILVT